MEQFCYENLVQLHDTAVTVIDWEGRRAELVVMDVYPCELRGEDWETFGITLRGEPQLNMRHGTYTLSHPRIGDTLLFLSPTSETDYQTVVARRVSTH